MISFPFGSKPNIKLLRIQFIITIVNTCSSHHELLLYDILAHQLRNLSHLSSLLKRQLSCNPVFLRWDLLPPEILTLWSVIALRNCGYRERNEAHFPAFLFLLCVFSHMIFIKLYCDNTQRHTNLWS